MENQNEETNKAMEKAEEVNKTPSLVDEARKAVEEMKQQNAERRALVEREEKIMAHNVLAGQANAGRSPKKEETPQEYRDRIMKGA